MKVFLDENFPLPLYHRLRGVGVDVEHVIVLGQRGASDDEIRRRLLAEELLFLTNDLGFAELPPGSRTIVVISRLRQSRPILERVTLWFSMVQAILNCPPSHRVLELLDSGDLMPWEIRLADGS